MAKGGVVGGIPLKFILSLIFYLQVKFVKQKNGRGGWGKGSPYNLQVYISPNTPLSLILHTIHPSLKKEENKYKYKTKRNVTNSTL